MHYSRILNPLPVFSLKSLPGKPEPEWAVPPQETLAYLLPVNSAAYERVYLDKVSGAVKNGLVAGVRSLLMIDEPVGEKRRSRAAAVGYAEIASDGPWHFFIRKEPGPAVLFAELLGRNSADARAKRPPGSATQRNGAVSPISNIVRSSWHDVQTVCRVTGVDADELAASFGPSC